MPISVVVGGQFGSEGKGKVAHFLARERRATFAVRVGGPNSGHTVVDDFGQSIIFRHLPTACLLPDVVSAIPPGAYLHVPTLLAEIARVKLDQRRLAIDPNAWVIHNVDIEKEENAKLTAHIGSTASGTGAALIRRMERADIGLVAKDVPELRPYLRETTELLVNGLQREHRIIVEGTQGFGLSLLHSALYPYCTSRDTTAAAFISEAGLSPLDADEVVLVIRAFPIRVGGPSGPLPNEINWATVTAESGSSTLLCEYTSVTQRIRRVARFDPEIVKKAITHNRPTGIALNHLDYVDCSCAKAKGPTLRALEFVATVEGSLNTPISWIGTDPGSLFSRDMSGQRLAV